MSADWTTAWLGVLAKLVSVRSGPAVGSIAAGSSSDEVIALALESEGREGQIMSELTVVAPDQMRAVVRVLASLTWPVRFKNTDLLLAKLGWQRLHADEARSEWAVSVRSVQLAELAGELASLEFRVSDTVADGDPVGQAEVDAAYCEMTGTITACLGFEPTGELRREPGVKWDLRTGGRINLLRGRPALIVQLWSKQLADLERAEIRFGVDADDDWDDD